jgi:hypothetical protein
MIPTVVFLDGPSFVHFYFNSFSFGLFPKSDYGIAPYRHREEVEGRVTYNVFPLFRLVIF